MFMFFKIATSSVARGSQSRSCLRWSIYVPFSMFEISKKSTLGLPFAPSRSMRSNTLIRGWRTLTDLRFSANHSTYCAVGTYWFFKSHFLDGDLLILCFFLSFFVNAEPLHPPVFEKIVPHFKNEFFQMRVFCVCVFLLFFLYVC